MHYYVFKVRISFNLLNTLSHFQLNLYYTENRLSTRDQMHSINNDEIMW